MSATQWTTNDYFFVEHGAEEWPSSNPKDSPFNVFICKKCGYTFKKQIYGSFPIGQNPHQEAEDLMCNHIMKFHMEKI